MYFEEFQPGEASKHRGLDDKRADAGIHCDVKPVQAVWRHAESVAEALNACQSQLELLG